MSCLQKIFENLFSNLNEYYLHHSVPITVYGYMLFNDKFIGFGICCVLLEINTVFLFMPTLLRDYQINCAPVQACMTQGLESGVKSAAYVFVGGHTIFSARKKK